MNSICKTVLSIFLAFLLKIGAAALVFILLMGALIATRYTIDTIKDKSNGIIKPIISEDYSEIILDSSTYVHIPKSEIPRSFSSRDFYGDDMIWCDVEGSSKPANWFFTNYIYLSEDNMYAHLTTDYDVSPSPYYQLKLEK